MWACLVWAERSTPDSLAGIGVVCVYQTRSLSHGQGSYNCNPYGEWVSELVSLTSLLNSYSLMRDGLGVGQQNKGWKGLRLEYTGFRTRDPVVWSGVFYRSTKRTALEPLWLRYNYYCQFTEAAILHYRPNWSPHTYKTGVIIIFLKFPQWKFIWVARHLRKNVCESLISRIGIPFDQNLMLWE